MSYDLKRSHFSLILEKEVLPAEEITEEGMCLTAELDPATGTEKVKTTDGDTGDVVAGFSIRDNADNATTSVVEILTVPAAPGPYTVTTANNNIVTAIAGDGAEAQMYVECPAGTELTLVDGIVAADGQVALEPVTGIMFFHEDETGLDAVVTYRYNLTVAEARQTFYQRNINNEASALFGQVSVGQGHGEIYTDQFDATLDWSTAGQAITSGADGVLTQGGNGAILDARVISVPNVNNPLLGIAFDLGGAAT